MKHNQLTREGIYWTATVLHSCGHEREFLRVAANHNNGDGCTIGRARKIVRAEAGMRCPDCCAKRTGRPRIAPEGTTSHRVTLTADTLATAQRLGAGNLSRGVRSALALVCDAHAALAIADYDGASPDQRDKLVRQIRAAERALKRTK